MGDAAVALDVTQRTVRRWANDFLQDKEAGHWRKLKAEDMSTLVRVGRFYAEGLNRAAIERRLQAEKAMSQLREMADEGVIETLGRAMAVFGKSLRDGVL